MKRILMLCLLISASETGFSQQLAFSQLGSEPAYCRQFSYQNGNGIVYASATGGTPGYTYQWTNLGNFASTSNTVWGGLNPGDYEIKIWDNAGDSIVDVVTLDSLNPIADFDIYGLNLVAGNYIGFAPAFVEFHNQSQNFANPNNPNSDTTFFWNLDYDSSPWLISHDVNEIMYNAYYAGGTYQACMVTINKNSCADTACVNIGIFGSLANIYELPGGGSFNISGLSDSRQIVVHKSNSPDDVYVRLYDVSGRLVVDELITEGTTTISGKFNSGGIYIYEILDQSRQNPIGSGKLIFP